MAKIVYLLCGVPGSGKTWVAKQLTDKFNYIENDDFIASDWLIPIKNADKSKPVLLTTPFAERLRREVLEKEGYEVRPIFIVESPAIVAQRYAQREGHPATQSTLTRAKTILERAKEWNAPYGTSFEVWEMLKKEKV